jgi:hypothetical protein
VSAASSNESIPGLIGSIAVTGPGTAVATSRTLVITPGANLPSSVTNKDGTATITLTATDGTNISTFSFPLTVSYMNQAPSLAGLSSQSIPANSGLTLAFKANDPDTAASNLVVTATSSPSTLGTLSLTSSGNDQTLSFMPTNGAGQTIVSVVASDGATSVTNTLTITVTPATPPVLGTIADQTIIANNAAVVAIPVTDAVSYVTNLTYTGTSDNPALISKISFAVVGSIIVATVTPVTNGVGSAHITIAASDAMTNASTTFALTVRKPNPMQLAQTEDQDSNGGASFTLPLGLTLGEVPLASLAFAGAGTNAALVSGVSFNYAGGNPVAVMHLVANKSGVDYITISVTDGFATNSSSFLLTVEAGVAPPTLNVVVVGNKLVLSFVGAPNAQYSVQATPNLRQAWSDVATLTADANGSAAYTNPVSSTVPVQFFRAVAK